MTKASSKPYHVVAIGNAIVDVISQHDQDFPANNGMKHGQMDLLDFSAADPAARAREIYDRMKETSIVSGGSAANTLAGLAQMGQRCAFIGRVRDDEMGAHFRHNLKAIGVDYRTPSNTEGPPTAQCLIIVTPDGERTMNTFLGAAGEVFESDIDDAMMRGSEIVFAEGYMWDKPCTKQAIRKAIAIAKEANCKVAFTASAEFCIANHRAEFQQMLAQDIDIFFCNEEEAKALYPEKSWEETLDTLQSQCEIAAVTLGEKGSIILTPGARYRVAATPVTNLVDTTGAGDMYAAGFLHGLCQGHGMEVCAKIGGATAAVVIQQIGARADTPAILRARDAVLAKDKGAALAS